MLHAAGALGKLSSWEREVGRRSGRRVPLRPAAGLRLSAQWGGRRHSGVRPLTVPARGGAPGPAWASPVTVQGG